MRRRFENNAKLYEYKIVSNCIGGGVIVEGKKVGTIPQGGQFIFLSKKRTAGFHKCPRRCSNGR